MQSTLGNCESNVSSTTSPIVPQHDHALDAESTATLLVAGTGTPCTTEAHSASSAEPLTLSGECVHTELGSTVLADLTTQTDTRSNEKGETCVSSQQMDSSSSDENEDDNHSDQPNCCDNASDVSEFSDFSQESWQPVQGPIAWVQEQMRRGQSPRKILQDLVPSGTVIPESLDPIMLWKIIISIVSEPPKRKKLNDINTLDDVLRVLSTSKKIIVLTGAGVSVSCGIPDFRSRDGVYARLAKDFPNLPDPQAMFDIHFFRHDPRPFFKFAREIYPGQFKPSPCHRFIRMLEEKGKLLRNYTQNIDTLEQVAGIQRVVQCHGSFATASCTVCGHKVDSSAIRDEIFNQVIPRCPRCSPAPQNAVMKPDIVFFGEGLPEHFHNKMAADKDECDLLIVIGSSLKVRPVALIPNSLPASVPQILINRERLHYLNFDVELLGNCDDIVGELCRRLGPSWEELAASGPPLSEVLMSSLPTPPASPHSGDSAKWDDASNSEVTSLEGSVNCPGNKLEFHPVAAGQADEAVTSDQTSRHRASSAKSLSSIEDDSGVQEVATSLSGPSLTKMRKYHRPHSPHNRSIRRPLVAADLPAVETAANSSDGDEASDIFCSPKEMESLVSACHRKDVVFAPPEKSSFGHHDHHEANKSQVHHCHSSSGFELSKSPDCQKNCHSMDSQEHKPGFVTSEEVSSHCEMKTFQDKTDSRFLTSEMVEHKMSSSSKTLIERAVDDRDVDEGAPESKKPRLSTEECEGSGDEAAGLKKGESKVSKSQLRGQSLSEVRKLWNSRYKVSLAQLLTDNQVLFVPPSRYIFKGAEVFSGSESDDDSSSSSDDYDANGSDSDMDKGSDEDRNSGNCVAEKISQGVSVSGEETVAEDLESSTLAADTSCNPKLTSPEADNSSQNPMLSSSTEANDSSQNPKLSPETDDSTQNPKITSSPEADDSSQIPKITSSPEADDSSQNPKLTSSLADGIGLKDSSSDSPVQSVLTVETRASAVLSESDISVQHSICTTSTDIPSPRHKISESSTRCQVSSSGNIDFEEVAPKSD
ncbi:hypothetical protein BsWGS_20355 [Bradybaena similaris]